VPVRGRGTALPCNARQRRQAGDSGGAQRQRKDEGGKHQHGVVSCHVYVAWLPLQG
jgi:hypothetical protein